MRFFPLLALFTLFPCAFTLADDADFSGVWVASLCPAGVKRETGKCSNFVLELHQKDGKLCGAHFFATAGAASIDEGAAPSLVGKIVEEKASVMVVSSRPTPPVRLHAELKKTGGGLEWERLEEPAGDYLLPAHARLTKSKSKTLFAPVFEQELRAACASAFTMIENSKEQTPPKQ